jgi:hypothetical protein
VGCGPFDSGLRCFSDMGHAPLLWRALPAIKTARSFSILGFSTVFLGKPDHCEQLGSDSAVLREENLLSCARSGIAGAFPGRPVARAGNRWRNPV